MDQLTAEKNDKAYVLVVTEAQANILRASLNHAAQNMSELKTELSEIFGVNMNEGELFFELNEVRGKVREFSLQED